MILNYEQVQKRRIFEYAAVKNHNNTVYDIRIGTIITTNGNKVNSYTIPPQGMIVVVSKEKLTIPENIVGYAHIRTSLSSMGIMAINIGIIDPGYSGHLSSILLNFGKEEFSINEDLCFLRTTFHSFDSVEINKLAGDKSITYEHYIDKKKFEATKYIDEKFMSFDKEVKKSVYSFFKSIFYYASTGSFTIAFVTAIIALIKFLLFPDYSINHKQQLENIQIKYDSLTSQYLVLKERTDSLIHIQRDTVSQFIKDKTVAADSASSSNKKN